MNEPIDRDKLQYATYFYDKKLQSNENSNYHHAFGTIQLYKKNYRGAENEFQKSIEVNPENVQARNDLALMNLKSQQYEDAEKQLQTAMRLETSKSYLNKNMSATLSRTGRYQEAISHAKQAISLDPYDASNHRNLAKLYDSTGDSRSSLNHNMNAIQLSSINSSSSSSSNNLRDSRRDLESKAYRAAAVQLVAQKGDISQALDLLKAARIREGKEYILPSSEVTQDLIMRIKQRQTKAGKMTSAEQRLNEVADKDKKMKPDLEKIKNGQFV